MKLTTALYLTTGLCATMAPQQVFAQKYLENGWVQDLPRPGYEPKLIRQGSVVLGPEVRFSTIADSNVFATSTNEESDVIFLVEPSVSINRRGSNSNIKADVYAGIRRFAENSRENVETFGFDASSGYRFNKTHSVSGKLGFDRTFERRDNPEANGNLGLPPTNINILSGELGYTYRPNRFGLAVRAGAAKANYLAAIDDDRDLTTYRVSARGLVGVSNKIDFFTEGYKNWRNFRTDLDRNAVNRDNSTTGVNAGITVEVTEKLQGDIGVGYFNANQDDPSLEDFSGVGASGRLRWRPRARTGVSLNFFRGDVATVRSGASGRIDTRLGMEVVQEVRHNFRLRGGVNYRRGEFRTAAGQKENDFNVRAGAEYFLNRHIALAADYSFRNREATIAIDEFDSHRVGLSLILTY